MALKQPENMDELVYFTRRTINDGKIKVWVFTADCPECKKGQMRKPIDSKSGKFKIRALEYVCTACGHEMNKTDVEADLTAYAEYVCPSCKKVGEGQIPFKRKKFQGVDALIFECSHCQEKLPVTKKMKAPKAKKSKLPIDDD